MRQVRLRLLVARLHDGDAPQPAGQQQVCRREIGGKADGAVVKTRGFQGAGVSHAPARVEQERRRRVAPKAQPAQP